MDLQFNFRSIEQERFFFSKSRNNCFSGGFGNGKTYVACQRAMTMLTAFENYRYVIARKSFKELSATTMQTFFKICPSEFIFQHDKNAGLTVFKNKSLIYWLHLDAHDEQSLRGLEINSALIDQAEEAQESIYLVLDSRIGRWDGCKVPQNLLDVYPNWPRDNFNRPRVPNYFDILCNPDTQYHWIYRKYHPESFEKNLRYFYIERETDANLNDPHTYQEMQNRDPEWVAKYVHGQWGASAAQIHHVNELSILNSESIPDFDKWISRILSKAALYRVMDHGDSSPTCCLWFAALNNLHICYREYYVGNTLISEHRYNITHLSYNETYAGDYADPQIFRKTAQKDGGYWSVSDEYLDSAIDAPAIAWSKADNNEFATRNRINELLKPSLRFAHPISSQTPSPGIYFIKRTGDYQYGCNHSIIQLKAQRREAIGNDNGKIIYADDRDESVIDHAYDPIRYYVSMHSQGKAAARRNPPRNTFAYFNNLMKRGPQIRHASNS